MTAEELFLVRLDAMTTQCGEVEEAIKSPEINRNLYVRAGTNLLRKVGDEQQRINNLRAIVKGKEIGPGYWETLRANGERSATLFGECLAFLQASSARSHTVDADLCDLADSLLDELAGLTEIKWGRFTVLATEEFFLDLAQIIRLRFPFLGIWDLPVAGHEFGHFIAGRLNLARPDGSHYLPFPEEKESFRQQNKDLGEEWMFYLEEYFADVFATFVLGPAYACTCIYLRFDPASAQDERDKRHPSYLKRAWAILQTLRRMDSEKDSKGDFKQVGDLLANLWHQTLVCADKSAPISNEDQARIGGIVSLFYEMLKDGIPGARFHRWASAKTKCQWVSNPASAEPNQIAALKITDMLNAAWLCRTMPDADPDQLSKNVIKLFRTREGIPR